MMTYDVMMHSVMHDTMTYGHDDVQIQENFADE